MDYQPIIGAQTLNHPIYDAMGLSKATNPSTITLSTAAKKQNGAGIVLIAAIAAAIYFL